MQRSVALPRPLALPRVAAWQAVCTLLALSTLVRVLVAFRRETPMYFPDEYMYSELGRSLATTGHPLVRGAHAEFPALLQPLVTAPAWLLDDVGTAYHVIQVMNALAMSLAAVPVYLLARRVGVGVRLAVAAAVLAVALPDLLYAGWMISEPYAYPLAVLAAYAAVRALERPTPRTQLAFLGASGLASFARVQFLILPLCFAAAAVVVEARDVRFRSLLRYWPVLVVVALCVVAVVIRGDSLGAYRHLLELDAGWRGALSNIALQSLSLLYGAGWVIVPAAVLGLTLSLVRPTSRAELAFGAFASLLIPAFVLQASLWGDSEQMQQRYLFYAVPLLGIAFAVYAQRGWPWRRAHALGCGGMLVLAATVPLSGYAVKAGKQHATFLFAVTRAEELLGGIGSGALAFGATAGALSAAAAALAWSRRATVAVTALAVAACMASAALAASYDFRYDAAVRRDYLPADKSWVDHSGARNVALLYGYGQPREGLEQLFWNRSVRRVLLMPGSPPPDDFAVGVVKIADDGSLRANGRPLAQPLLVDGGRAVVVLRGGRKVAASQAYALWQLTGHPRLARYFNGWYRDGWLANSGSFRIWGRHISGRIRFAVRRDAGEEPGFLAIRAPETSSASRIAPGTTRTIEITACAQHRWAATFSVLPVTVDSERLLGMRATRPVWIPDAKVC
jgi:hypothetical protein